MIDLKKLWEAMPRDVQRKISCHDLKRIVDNYNGPCSADQIIQALREQIQHDIKMCAEAIEEMELQRNALAKDFFAAGHGTERTKQARYKTYLRLLAKGFPHAGARDAANQLIHIG